ERRLGRRGSCVRRGARRGLQCRPPRRGMVRGLLHGARAGGGTPPRARAPVHRRGPDAHPGRPVRRPRAARGRHRATPLLRRGVKMNDRLRSLMVGHGALVFLVGMVAGFPFAFAILGRIVLWPFPGAIDWTGSTDVRAWRMAHLEGILNGLTLIGV